MSWRTWTYQKLVDVMGADAVFAGGSITVVPEIRPMVVYRLQNVDPLLRDNEQPVTTGTNLEVWVYDEPGSYDLIDVKIKAIREALVGQVALPGKTVCRWLGDSGELADDEWKAIVRNSAYQLIGEGS